MGNEQHPLHQYKKVDFSLENIHGFDDKKILSSLLILIKQKTKSIDETLKYLDFLYSQIK